MGIRIAPTTSDDQTRLSIDVARLAGRRARVNVDVAGLGETAGMHVSEMASPGMGGSIATHPAPYGAPFAGKAQVATLRWDRRARTAVASWVASGRHQATSVSSREWAESQAIERSELPPRWVWVCPRTTAAECVRKVPQ